MDKQYVLATIVETSMGKKLKCYFQKVIIGGLTISSGTNIKDSMKFPTKKEAQTGKKLHPYLKKYKIEEVK